jgi:hypothetical protein
MKPAVLVLLVAFVPVTLQAQSATQKAPAAKPPVAPATQEIQTEKIGTPPATPPPVTAQTGTAGYLEPAQVKALLHKVWLAQYRINDLLTQVNPEKWKMPDTARKSFGQTLESLRQALASEEEWRAQFDARPDSLYLGFQTYVAINSVLPRMEGVAHSVAQYENPSFGAQYSQAANQLFDLQQSLQPHLASLLKNQDGVMLAAQTNLASCQNELGFAMRPRQEKATPMKNIAPEFKGRHVHHATESAGGAKTEKSSEKKTAPNKAGTKKAAAHPTQKTQPAK